MDYSDPSFLNIKALLATGDLDMDAANTDYDAIIPSSASLQYEHNTLTSPTDYFSDDMGWSDGGTYTVTNCGFRGFLYAGRDMTNAGGNSKMVGSIFVG